MVCGIALLAFLLLVRLRLRVVLTPEFLEYTGIFSTRRILFSEVQAVRRAADKGYAASRTSGPFTYELRTSGESVRINLKLFPHELTTKLFTIIDAG